MFFPRLTAKELRELSVRAEREAAREEREAQRNANRASRVRMWLRLSDAARDALHAVIQYEAHETRAASGPRHVGPECAGTPEI